MTVATRVPFGTPHHTNAVDESGRSQEHPERGCSESDVASDSQHLVRLVEAQRAIVAAGTDEARAMGIVLDHALRLTSGDSASLWLLDEVALVCRSAAGPSATHPGLRLATTEGLLGNCCRSGEALHLGEAELDSRADAELHRRAGTRSMILVPLRNDEKVMGLLEVSSSSATALDSRDVAALELLGGMTAIHLQNAAELTAKHALIAERAAMIVAQHESEERFRNAFEYAGIGVTLVALDGRLLRVNRAFGRILGYLPKTLTKFTFQQITHPEDLGRDMTLRARLLEGQIESYEMEKRYLHRTGSMVWVLLTVSLVRTEEGTPLYFIAQVQDISTRKAAEASQARLSAIVETMPDMVAICEADGRVSYLNASSRRQLGFGDAQPTGILHVTDVQPQFVMGGALTEAVKAVRRDGIWRGETTLRRSDGRELPVEEILLAYPPDGGETASITAILHDISERKHAETTLRSMALMDELTGLYNRRGFLALAEEELSQARRQGWPVLLFYGDLDEFKKINDTHGHAQGDRALMDVAGLLRSVFRESDVIGRVGGDEFSALVPYGTPGTETRIRERLRERLAEFVATAARPYRLSLSLGAARSGVEDTRSLAELLDAADMSLLERKRNRRTHGVRQLGVAGR